jgi:23S rRNA (adenine2030-N6)-methyltransferase
VLAGPPIAALAPYLEVVRQLNAGETTVTRYPGSPWLARKLLRPKDRLLLCENRGDDVVALRRATAGDRRVEVRAADGWTTLKSDLPPRERRGLVLIDPPFEADDEHERLARGLGHAWRRWATGCYLAWYPIKARAPVAALHAAVVAAGLRRVHALELRLEPEREDWLVGCGLLLVNPPWPILDRLGETMPALAGRLARDGEPRWSLETLAGE